MATLSNADVGSVVYNLIDGIPVGISGTLPLLANNAVYFAEQFTGDAIGITAISEVYQPAIIDLTVSNVLSLMDAQGIGTKIVKIGELSIEKGMSQNSATLWKNMAMEKLNQIGQHVSSYQTWN